MARPRIASNYAGSEPPCSEKDGRFLEKPSIPDTLLAGSTPQQQSGFGLDSSAWECLRRPIVEHIHKSGSFFDIGCANGLLMESLVDWAGERGFSINAFGLDISERLVELARQRLPRWHERFYVGNALLWEPPVRFDFVRAEWVYVPAARRCEFIGRLLDRFVAPGGKLILCSYGSSRLEGQRAELLLEPLEAWGFRIAHVEDALCPEHGFVITRSIVVQGRS